MPDRPVLVALLGGECTGKSTLANGLADRYDAVVVPEKLREFVDSMGRTPNRDEQFELMNAQIAGERASLERAALGGRNLVVADPAALMAAVYSIVYFADDSLLPAALDHQRNYQLTILCDSDIPWRPDGVQRDGHEFRARTSHVIEHVVNEYQLPVVRVTGSVNERVQQVSLVLAPLLRAR